MNFRSFIKNRSGSVALITALMSVPIMGAVGASFDYAIMRNIQSAMQNGADSSVLGSAKELALTSNDDSTIKEIAKQYVIASLSNGFNLDKYRDDLTIQTEITDNRKSVTVNLALKWQPLILHYFSANAYPIRIRAKATLAGSETICIIALSGKVETSLKMSGVSSVNANGCAIYSNSSTSTGITIDDESKMQSANTYSVGGYYGPLYNYKPTPIVSAPTIADPMKDRIPPKSTGCKKKKFVVRSGHMVLYPGTYCGGIKIQGSASVELKPGEYILKDGQLAVLGNGVLKGRNVGFVFEGTKSTLKFTPNSTVSLTAPKSGPLAGIIFFEDRNSPLSRRFTIQSKNARQFEGTVYLPNGKLTVSKNAQVGQDSKWTAIIANSIVIGNGSHLQINSNFAGSDIPAPEGVGPNGNGIRLVN